MPRGTGCRRPSAAAWRSGCRIDGATYTDALRARSGIDPRREGGDRRCDVVVAPACVQTAPPFDDVDRPVAGVAATWPDVSARTMALWNVTGLPAVAVPIGFGDAGLPIGMQVAGAAFADERCLAVAAAFQAAPPITTAHRSPPPPTEAAR